MRNELRIVMVVATLALGACAQASNRPAPESGKTATSAAAGDRTARLEHAIATALASHPGEAIEAGLESEGKGDARRSFIEVMILDKQGRAFEVRVDPEKGSVISSNHAEEDDEGDELAAVVKRLPDKHLTLGELVQRGGGSASGELVVVMFAPKKEGGVVGLIRFADGETTTQVLLDPKSGDVLSSGKVVMEEDDDDGDDDDGDEGDDDDDAPAVK